MIPDPELACIDKNFLYGKYEAGEERNRMRREASEKLAEKVAHKALDIARDPDEEMKVEANKTTTNNGLGLKELALVGALMAGTGVGGAGLTAMLLDKDTPAPVMQPAEHADSDTLFDLQFTEPKDAEK